MKIVTRTVLAFSLFAASAFSQGMVDFNTKAVGARVFYYHIYHNNGLDWHQGTPIPATGNDPINNLPFYGQLYAAAGAGALEATLQPVGRPVTFRGNGDPDSSNAGYLLDLNPVAVTPTGGGAATVQLRAWTGAEAYEIAAALALARTPGAGAGSSAPVDLETTGNPNSAPNVVELTGLQGFTFFAGFINIPEPSTYALFGGGLIFFGVSRFRKRK
jgi:hypothetical protein